MYENDIELEEMAIGVAIDDGGFAPVRGHATDAGLDLRCPERVVVPKGGSAVIDTKIRMSIPMGFFGKLESKSGLNINHGVVCLGGVIDSGYTGTIVTRLYNFGDEDYVFEAGDKCVQIIIQPCEVPHLLLDQRVADEDRGDGGYGSTGR